MTTGQVSPEDLAQDLVLAMRHLQPALAALLALLQNADQTAESRIEALTTVLERVATALEGTSGQLQALGPRMQAQETGLADLAARVEAVVQQIDRENRARAALDRRIGELLAVLSGPPGPRG